MLKVKYSHLLLAIGVSVLQGCVPAREFQALQDKSIKCEEERERFAIENESLGVRAAELDSRNLVLQGNVEKLLADSTTRSIEVTRLRDENSRLIARYDELQRVQENLMAGSHREARRVLAELQTTQEKLQVKEDALKESERRLNQRRKEVDDMQVNLNKLHAELEQRNANLNALQKQLEERNARLVELESILARKDSAVNALRRTVADALFGFEGKGLSVRLKNGKVYVSLDEKLMFRSGSHVVDAQGVAALRQLIPVLEQSPDINIMVEGHTDDVPFPQRGELLDNWDLSTKRATSIVRLLLQGTRISPERIIAAGRSQYHPVDPARTPVARQKNRRTEIILTPKLDEIFNMLEAN